MQAYFFIHITPNVVSPFLYHHVLISAWYTEMQITSETPVSRSNGHALQYYRHLKSQSIKWPSVILQAAYLKHVIRPVQMKMGLVFVKWWIESRTNGQLTAAERMGRKIWRICHKSRQSSLMDHWSNAHRLDRSESCYNDTTFWTYFMTTHWCFAMRVKPEVHMKIYEFITL
jgi:hypothetical protein